jgi:hypothetical protein
MDYKHIYIIDTYRIGDNLTLYAFDSADKCYNFLQNLYPSYNEIKLKKLVKKSILLNLDKNPQKFNLDTKYITFACIQDLFSDDKYYYYDNKEYFLEKTDNDIIYIMQKLIYENQHIIFTKNKINERTYPFKCVQKRAYSNKTKITKIFVKNYITDIYILVEDLPIL